LALDVDREAEGEVEAGRLRCEACPASYPIVRFVPRFVSAENYAANFGFQWNRFPRTQLDSFSGVPISRDRFGRETGWTQASLNGKRVLDVGCGAGRFAEVALAFGATVVALDYSGAVDACRANLPSDRLHVVQADIYSLPFEPALFDYVYSLGVIQHTPDAERAVKSIVAQLRPGGTIVVDVYPKHWKGWFHPRVWLRPLTTRLDASRLFRVIERSTPALMRISNVVGAVPAVGSQLRRLVPVANYTGVLPLSDAQLREWAVLDTFDWLGPAFDRPQAPGTMRRGVSRGG